METNVLNLLCMGMGKKIKARRGSLGYTQEYMAIELNITTATYQNYEYDRSALINPNFYKICKVLNIHPMELIETEFQFGEYKQAEDINLILCQGRIATLEEKIESLIAENAVLRFRLGK